MIIIPIKDGENIERALKKYKKKYERTGTIKELRNRKQYDKPSVINRAEKIKAIYVEKLRKAEE
ncbi:MAG: 30S ribosomal protein S21 [Vicingaceae bacterium]|nr:30S ribosomal protein S21 [Vicingaceae bacterium]